MAFATQEGLALTAFFLLAISPGTDGGGGSSSNLNSFFDDAIAFYGAHNVVIVKQERAIMTVKG